MDTTRIKEWTMLHPYSQKASHQVAKKVGLQGTAPSKVMYLTGATSGEFSDDVTQYATLIPTVYNADTLGIRPDLIDGPVTSWADLMRPEFKEKLLVKHSIHRNYGCRNGCRSNG